MPEKTYDAYGGLPFYDRTIDGARFHGPNNDDRSIISRIEKLGDGKLIVKFLEENYLSPVQMVRAYNACGIPGVATVKKAVADNADIAAWYAKFPPLVTMSWDVPAIQATSDLATEGEALILAIQAYVAKVNAR